MSEGFDPYYSWLGIPVSEQPADHYCLLGVQRFESNLDVISNAADRQMAFVQTFKTGKHSSDSQRVLNEISAAKLCLLNPAKRAEYDADLRARLAESATPAESSPPVAASFSSGVPLGAWRTVPVSAPSGSGAWVEVDSPSTSGEPVSSAKSIASPPLAASHATKPSIVPAPGAANRDSKRLAGYITGLVVGVIIALGLLFSLAPDGVEPPGDLLSVSRTDSPGEETTSPRPGASPVASPDVEAKAVEAARLEATQPTTPSPRAPIVVAPVVVAPVGREEPVSETPRVIESSGDSPAANASPANLASAPAPQPAVGDGSVGEWIDLLEWAENVDWKPYGIDWNANLIGAASRTGLTLRAGAGSVFPLPALIDGDYDLEVDFRGAAGRPPYGVLFPVANHIVQLRLGDAAKTDYLRFIDEVVEPRPATSRSPSRVVNEEPHRVAIHVRVQGDQADVAIDLDDERNYIRWQGEHARLVNMAWGDWRTTMLRRVWLAVGPDDSATFTRVKLKMLSGTARRDVITIADRAEDLKNGLVRLVGEPASNVKVGWNAFVVNQFPIDAESGACDRRWPRVTETFERCRDSYWAHAPAQFECPIPRGAKSFSVFGYNTASGQVKYIVDVDGERVYESPRTGMRLVKVAIPPRAKSMSVIVNEDGDTASDHTWLCYPRFHSVPVERITGEMLDGDELPTLKFRVKSYTLREKWGTFAHKTLADASQTDGLIDFRNVVPCDEFLYAHAPSSVTYQVPEGMTRFTAVGYAPFKSGVMFEVWAGGKRLHQTPSGEMLPINVALPPGVRSIDLRVNDQGDRGNDQSYWCYPRLHRE